MNKNTTVPYLIKTNGDVSMYLDGESVVVAKDHPNYNLVIDVLKTGRHEKLSALVFISKQVETYIAKSSDRIKIDSGIVTYDGFPLHNTLTERILKMMADGFKFDHMLKFLENLMANPSKRAVEELYTFLENYGLPITEDGCFLAYKAVRRDYYDSYTGKTHLNTVGSVIKMARNMVDDNWGKDCSQGLHVGALDYVVQYGSFVKGQIVPNSGNRLLVCKVNPANVVSVPEYAKFTKMRVCEYTVVDEIEDTVKELDKVLYKTDDTGVSEAAPDAVEKPVETDTNGRSWPKAAINGVGTPSGWNGVQSEDDDWLDEDYITGYNIGLDDGEAANPYGYSRDYSRSSVYRTGYNDGFHSRTPLINLDVSYEEVDEENDGDCCGCGHCDCGREDYGQSTEEIEYDAGYDLGRSDCLDGVPFQHSLDVDTSDTFKNGYADGWDSLATL